MHKVLSTLEEYADGMLPRILTQVCRDPDSPAQGCFDRHWWHYKIRDFPSIILQQGAFTLWLARNRFAAEERSAVERLAGAACRFWARRAMRGGAFEEYYPREDGYPPLAFSTLAVARLVLAGACEAEPLLPAFQKAAEKLLTRVETRAGNQQVAGLAALAYLRKLESVRIPEGRFEELVGATLALQHENGWYEEYGGPDLGYLSVAMDCLWDLYDVTGDARFSVSAERALGFLHPFCRRDHVGAGMHNARNTDYILPYGIARFLAGGNRECAEKAAALLRGLYGSPAAGHCLRAVDDRYICHYIGHSVMRALPLTAAQVDTEIPSAYALAEEVYLEDTGHLVLGAGETRSYEALCSAHKGGILTVWRGADAFSDFGWQARRGKTTWITHWWSGDWRVDREENRLSVSGFLVPHVEQESTPLKHAALRVLTRLFGRHLITLLKNRMIFKKTGTSPYPFHRTIRFEKDCVVLIDSMAHAGALHPTPAPRSSKRHVASADSFHAEDWGAKNGWTVRQTTRRDADGTFHAETIITRGDL